jgi:hypothetical protein
VSESLTWLIAACVSHANPLYEWNVEAADDAVRIRARLRGTDWDWATCGCVAVMRDAWPTLRAEMLLDGISRISAYDKRYLESERR